MTLSWLSTNGKVAGKATPPINFPTSSVLVNAFSVSSFFPLAMLILRVTSYVTVAIGQYGTLLSVRNRRVSTLQSNPLWGPRRNLLVLVGMTGTILICIVNLYGSGFQRVFGTAPIPGMFWGLPYTFALGILLMDETRKAIVRKYPKVCFELHDSTGS
jgi:hypothetical protein